MSSGSQLPSWVSYMQALAVPIVALVGAWIAAQQMLIAYDKLQHDKFFRIYDRRVAVYEATRQLLADVFQKDLSEDAIRVYGLKTLDAKFLFDDKMYSYLRDLQCRVSRWNYATLSAERHPGSDEASEFKRLAEEQLQWIVQQGQQHGGFETNFVPFLVYPPIKRPWPFRWPSAEA